MKWPFVWRAVYEEQCNAASQWCRRFNEEDARRQEAVNGWEACKRDRNRLADELKAADQAATRLEAGVDALKAAVENADAKAWEALAERDAAIERERERYDRMVERLTTKAVSDPVPPATVVTHPTPEAGATEKLTEWRREAIARGARDIRETMAQDGQAITDEEAQQAAADLYDGMTQGGG